MSDRQALLLELTREANAYDDQTLDCMTHNLLAGILEGAMRDTEDFLRASVLCAVRANRIHAGRPSGLPYTLGPGGTTVRTFGGPPYVTHPRVPEPPSRRRMFAGCLIGLLASVAVITVAWLIDDTKPTIVNFLATVSLAIWFSYAGIQAARRR